MVSEKYVNVRATTAEKKDLTLGINCHILGQPIPSLCFETGPSHGTHQRLKKATVRLMSISPVFSNNVANIADKLGKINCRWAAVITEAAGQAGPDIFVYRRRVNITGNNEIDQLPGREWFADQCQGAGGRAFPAVLTGKGIMIRNDLGQRLPADTF